MAVAVLVLIIGLSPLLFIGDVSNLLNLPPEITQILEMQYWELLLALFGK